MKVLLLIFASSICLSSSCKKKDDLFSVKKIPYVGNSLRVDGYYYNEDSPPTSWEIYFFYKDGTLLYGGALPISSVPTYENYYKNGQFYSLSKSDKTDWGEFRISLSSIEFERWYPSSGGPLQSYIRYGTILNDTTFIITKTTRSNGTEERSKNETYHFKKFSPKPDSTNTFVQ